MTLGYECNKCHQFYPGRDAGGTYSTRVKVDDEKGPKWETREAHFCFDCAERLSEGFGIVAGDTSDPFADDEAVAS